MPYISIEVEERSHPVTGPPHQAQPWTTSDLAVHGTVSVVLATLFFVDLFRVMVFARGPEQFYVGGYSTTHYVAVLLNTLLLAGAGLALRLWTRGSRTWFPVARACHWILLLPALAFIRPYVPGLAGKDLLAAMAAVRSEMALQLAVAAAAAAGVGAAWVVGRRVGVRLPRMVDRSLLLLAPFALLTLAQCIWIAVQVGPGSIVSASSSSAAARQAPRIVIFLFDELDQTALFESRLEEVRLPALDRLRAESVYLDSVRQAASETRVAIPALLTGEVITDMRPVSARDAELVFEDGKVRRWSELPSLWARLRERGLRSVVVGWYVPYCRVFATELQACYTYAYEGSFSERGLARVMGEQVMRSLPFHKERLRSSQYRSQLGRVEELLRQDDWDVLFVHWAIPHHPYNYDAASGRFRLLPRGAGYFDNLALVDRTISEVRSTLEQTGQWENTHLLVTSDHGWRAAKGGARTGLKVPMLVKMSHHSEGIAMGEATTAHVFFDLVLKLADGRSTPEEFAAWLRRETKAASGK